MKKRASLKFFVASLFFFAIAKWLLPDISGLTEEAGDFVVGLGMFLGGSMLVLSLYMLALSRLHTVTADGQKVGVYNKWAEVKKIALRDILAVSAVPLFPRRGGRYGPKAYAESWPAWNPILRFKLSDQRYFYLPITKHKREQEIVLGLLRTLQQRGIELDRAVEKYLQDLGVSTSGLTFTHVLGSPRFISKQEVKKSMTIQGLTIVIVVGVLAGLVWLAYNNPDGWLTKAFAIIERWN